MIQAKDLKKDIKSIPSNIDFVTDIATNYIFQYIKDNKAYLNNDIHIFKSTITEPLNYFIWESEKKRGNPKS